MKNSRIGMGLAVVGAYAALRIALEFGRIGGQNKALLLVFGLISVLGFMLVQLAVIPAVVRIRPNVWHALLFVVFGAAGMVAVKTIGKASFPGGVPAYFIASDFAIMLMAVPLGYIVSFIIREPNILLPVGIVAGMVDMWNVVIGPLGRIVEQKPEIVESVSVHVPAAVPAVLPVASIGGGDIVFLALFFSVIYRFGLNARTAFWLGYLLLTVSIFLSFRLSIPALVPMGLAILITNLKHFKLSRDELASTVIVMGLVAALLIWLTTKLPVIFEMLGVK